MLLYLENNTFIFLIATSCISLAVGSFLNVVITRLPLLISKETKKNYFAYIILNLASPRSHCPYCNHYLTWSENIPLLSYLLLKGKCKKCLKKISIRYPLVEILTTLLSLIVVIRMGASWGSAWALLFTWILIALAFIDIKHLLLPNTLTIPLIFVGIIANSLNLFATLLTSCLGAVLGFFILWLIFRIHQLITGREGLGYGDFKFTAAIGAWVGWPLLPALLFIAASTGLIVSLIQVCFRKISLTNEVPFGPYLAFGGWISLLWGPNISQFYIFF